MNQIIKNQRVLDLLYLHLGPNNESISISKIFELHICLGITYLQPHKNWLFKGIRWKGGEAYSTWAKAPYVGKRGVCSQGL